VLVLILNLIYAETFRQRSKKLHDQHSSGHQLIRGRKNIIKEGNVVPVPE
jgi:hypothetical protein